VHDPRVIRSRAAVIEAAIDLLATRGAEGFTIDAVAKRSGVARTTIYRHWPEPDALLIDAIAAVCAGPRAVDTGSVRDDLLAVYVGLVDALRSTRLGTVLPVMLDLVRRDPSLKAIHRRFVADRRRPAIDAVHRAIERGELPAGTDAGTIVDRVAGPIFYRFLVVHDPLSAAAVERLVDDVLAAVRLSPTGSSSTPVR
jgi:AcrR family transcriptional regulator